MTPNSIVWKTNVYVFFCANYCTILKSIILLLRYCKRKWSQSYLNAKKRYLGMTGVTKNCIKALLNWITRSITAKKKLWRVVKSHILMIRVAGITIAGISKDFHKSWTEIILYSSFLDFVVSFPQAWYLDSWVMKQQCGACVGTRFP